MMNIAELLNQNPTPSDVALIDRSKKPALEVSVAEITNQVHVFAQAMIDFGLTPGSRIGLLAGNLGDSDTFVKRRMANRVMQSQKRMFSHRISGREVSLHPLPGKGYDVHDSSFAGNSQ